VHADVADLGLGLPTPVHSDTVRTMNDDVALTFRIRLRALQWTSSLLRQLSHSTDEEAVMIAANWALSTVYDLSEAYWRLLPDRITSTGPQDAHFESLAVGETVGGLLVARGKMTHELAGVSSISPLRGLPYDFAGLTDWAWAAPTWQSGLDRRTGLDKRIGWYGQRVSGRALWVPIEEAEWWFSENGPQFRTGEAVQASDEWITGLTPVFLDTDEVILAQRLQDARRGTLGGAADGCEGRSGS
jgi:hypothetical protein